MTSIDDYQLARSSKLKLKGSKHKLLFKGDKLKKKKAKSERTSQLDPDTVRHGGWWRIADECDLIGGANIAVECGNGSNCYLAAMDNGRFTIGGPHIDKECPLPEEILTLIKTPDDSKISLKTGYGKYVGVDAQGALVAVSDAIGARERLIAVFQDGKTAIQTVSNNCFLCMTPDSEGYIFAVSKKAGDNEMVNLLQLFPSCSMSEFCCISKFILICMVRRILRFFAFIIKIRTNAEKEGPVEWRNTEDLKPAGQCEDAYVKMYQHSKVGLKGKQINIDFNDKTEIRRAQAEGNLHELLLDRRTKTKSDKYC
ncbi:hypothetical protein AB6A40_010340 [Gnathostoma spinigerum]|uniref:Actin-bundling protein n=1 Tax=Gnathostoma spinigerum TaxID=75299 RepID=A0ABD6EUT7_9BILA